MPKSILIVEDDTLLSNVLTEFLQTSGYEIKNASNAHDGLELFLNEPTEFVITDIKMPGMINGVDVVRRIKAFRPETRIIVCTGYPDELTAVENIAHCVIQKPFDLEKIKQVLPKL